MLRVSEGKRYFLQKKFRLDDRSRRKQIAWTDDQIAKFTQDGPSHKGFDFFQLLVLRKYAYMNIYFHRGKKWSLKLKHQSYVPLQIGLL